MLDDLLPSWDFRERHQRLVRADPDRTWAALSEVSLSDLALTRIFVAVRYLGRPSPQKRPLLSSGPLTLLDAQPERRAIAGTVGQPWRLRAPRRNVTDVAAFTAFDEPGWTKYLAEFRIDPMPGGCVLSTETRGRSTSSAARRRFRLYWLLIRIPSGLIRRDMLRAVARRAEAPGRAGPRSARPRAAL